MFKVQVQVQFSFIYLHVADVRSDNCTVYTAACAGWVSPECQPHQLHVWDWIVLHHCLLYLHLQTLSKHETIISEKNIWTLYGFQCRPKFWSLEMPCLTPIDLNNIVMVSLTPLGYDIKTFFFKKLYYWANRAQILELLSHLCSVPLRALSILSFTDGA